MDNKRTDIFSSSIRAQGKTEKADSMKLLNKLPEWNEGKQEELDRPPPLPILSVWLIFHITLSISLLSPTQHPELQSLVLRFNKGRVLAPSAKNFLMCIENQDNKEGKPIRDRQKLASKDSVSIACNPGSDYTSLIKASYNLARLDESVMPWISATPLVHFRLSASVCLCSIGLSDQSQRRYKGNGEGGAY